MYQFSISMDKQEAMSLLMKHKAQHTTDYSAAMVGWEKAMDKYSRLLNLWAGNGGTHDDRPHEPRKPDSYKDEYDKLISMLDYHTKDTIDIEEGEFDKIVLDKFNWSTGFRTTNAFYKSV